MKRYLLIAALLLVLSAAVLYYVNRVKVKAPEFVGFKSITVDRIDGQTAYISARIVFHNPNPFKAQLLNTQIKVYTEDVLVAGISQTELSEIGAGNNFEVPLKFEIDMLKLGMSQGLSGLLTQALNTERELPIRFDGYCRIRTKDKTFKVPLQFEDRLMIK
jgi:LEA14-like dessication related protein